MKRIAQNRMLLALVALLVLLAGCKAEQSPTAPSPSGTPGGTTGTTIAMSVSNATPLVSSTSTITATVTQNGSAAPNGTAVEFSVTSPGVFTDTNVATSIRTTTSGAATAVVTSASAANLTVTARVGSASKTATVSFSAQVQPPVNPDTTPKISDFNPKTGKPAGGDSVVITGTNFKDPVRILFDTGSGTKEAFVAASSATQVTVITPPVSLGPGVQKLDATVTAIFGAGTPGEVKVSAASKFTYQLDILTPTINSVAPPSGAKEGGTIITIVGEGFQAPVQVFFGGAPSGAGGALAAQAELQVIGVTYNQIVAKTPPFTATDTSLANGQVTLRVLNVNSAKDAVLASAFRYVAKTLITAFGPGHGPFTGGTKVRIDGQGFEDPVAVSIGGVGAQVISVSGSEIVAITSAVQLTSCANVTGPVSVVNISTQDGATTQALFTYDVPTPHIISVVPPSQTPGGTVAITILNAFGLPRISIGDTNVGITSSITNADGTVTYTVVVPSNLTLLTQACAAGGTSPLPTSFDVKYTAIQTGCTDTFQKGLQVTPPVTAGNGKIFFNPAGFTPFTATFVAAVVGPPAVPARFNPSAAQIVQLVNNGSGPLTITSVTPVGAGCAQFTLGLPPLLPAVLVPCDSTSVSASYNPGLVLTPPPNTASGSCTLSFVTDAGTKNLQLIGTAQ